MLWNIGIPTTIPKNPCMVNKTFLHTKKMEDTSWAKVEKKEKTASVSQPPAFKAPPPPCRFFQIGTCTAGANCNFAHTTGVVAKSDQVCKFWQVGKCAHGSSCAFRHGKPIAAPPHHMLPPKQPIAVPKPPQRQWGAAGQSILQQITTPLPPPPAVPWSPVLIDVRHLESMDPNLRRQQLGSLLYPRVAPMVGEGLGRKIVGMLLTMPAPQLLGLLKRDKPDGFEAAIKKCLATLPAELLQTLSITSPSCGCATDGPAAASRRAPESGQAPPVAYAGSVPPAPKPRLDPASEQALQSLNPTAAELEASRALACGVCLEPILARRGRFGLLEGCEHVFCDECLRQWRATHAQRPDVARACPECRAPSHFVIPSSMYVIGPRKAQLAKAYQKALRAIPCKHFNYGEGVCPFGTSCFYAHTDRNGRLVNVSPPRAAVGKDGTTVVNSYLLSEFLFPESSTRTASEALLASIPVVGARDSETAGEDRVSRRGEGDSHSEGPVALA